MHSPNPRSAKTSRRTSARGADRVSLYDEVTDRIIAELEAGRLPWVQPWGASGASGSSGPGPGLPRNALSRRPYSGVNVLILWGAVIAQGYPSQSWLTFRQARDAGGCVRKGEHGITVVYANRFVPRDAGNANGTELGGGEGRTEGGKPAARDGERSRAIPFLKRFTVFNVAQCEGLREGLAADPAPLPEREIVPVAEACIAASGIAFRIGGNRAFYAPAKIMCRFRRSPPSSSRSTITAPACTS